MIEIHCKKCGKHHEPVAYGPCAEDRSELSDTSGSTTLPVESIKMEDLRKTAKDMGVLPNWKMVRVSDEYWVMLENGKPKLTIPHSEIFE